MRGQRQINERRVMWLVVWGIAAATATSATASVFVPPGLAPGDTYQLAFVTAALDKGYSKDIDYYNGFVNTEASKSVLTEGVQWSAIVSTPTDDARVNALVSAPVYNMNGQLVATGFDDMWDGGLWAPIGYNQYANGINTYPWTGSDRYGRAYWGFDPINNRPTNTGPLGTGHIRYGRSSSTQYGYWIAYYQTWNIDPRPLYALSEPLPEPSTLALAAIGLLGLFGFTRRGRQRK